MISVFKNSENLCKGMEIETKIPVRERAKFTGNGAGHTYSGADTFLHSVNHGA